VLQMACRLQTAVLVSHAELQAHYTHLRGREDEKGSERLSLPQSALCLPLIHQRAVLGVVYFEATRRDAFPVSLIQLLQVLMAQAALSLTNARLHERMLQAVKNAEAASKSKSAFLSNMSHEIRTPMNAMLGVARMLADCDLSPDHMQLVDMLQSSGQLLLSIINDVLDLSRIESASLLLEQRSFRLAATLEQVTLMLHSFAAQKAIDLSLHLESDLPDTLVGDSVRLQQIVINCVNNAIKVRTPTRTRTYKGRQLTAAHQWMLRRTNNVLNSSLRRLFFLYLLSVHSG